MEVLYASSVTTSRDNAYKFTAPKWYDFSIRESEEDKHQSELWFEYAPSYAPSPSVPRIKARKSFKVENMRNFNNNITTDVQEQLSFDDDDNKENIPPYQTKACTPKPVTTDTEKLQTATKNRSVLMLRNQLQSSQSKTSNHKIIKRKANVKNLNLVQENQAIKRQKLDGGKSRQILNPKPATLPHKTKQGLVNTTFNLYPSVTKETRTENRKVYVREQINPFASTAESTKKFQTQNQFKPRPNEPEFMTSQRIRPVSLKSTAELEEEMMANMPKFKERPLNRKILAAPVLPAPKRSTPHPPVFQEFHLETMARANQHTETSSAVSREMPKHNDWKTHRTGPKSPLLLTMLRARPTEVKTTTEIELEELAKVPKFKAITLNKKIFESKGEMGIFCNTTKHVTVPQEFHFMTNERTPPHNSVIDLFDKLSLNSKTFRDKPLQKNTTPNPFILRTEERGSMKKKKFMTAVTQKQIEDERARIRKATPYPYSTDYPVIPRKPKLKQSTRPEPFHLESLARHAEEMRKGMEERVKIEREEAQKRVFRAQPVIKEDPIPLPDKVRKPLTEIQEFNLHVDQRPLARADFDHKIKEKEMMYKRHREETEVAKMEEEERDVKQLRRTMIPYARPVPNFNNPFLPLKSNKETTKPKSPKLRVLRRVQRKTMMASSSNHMR